MPDATQPSNPQNETLGLFTLLTRLRPEWRGTLIVCCGLGDLGSAVALAANAVGATCLAIEPDPVVCRAAMRAGACDFFVNTVDEALRVLKNEIRQRKPLSVALELNLPAALGELLERGVLPEVFTNVQDSKAGPDRSVLSHAAISFQTQGATILDLDGTLSPVAKAVDAKAFPLEHGLAIQTFVFDTSTALKAFDARLQQIILPGDPRRSWVVAAPRLFPRDRPYRRAVLLTTEEQAALG